MKEALIPRFLRDRFHGIIELKVLTQRVPFKNNNFNLEKIYPHSLA
jgi:hypothetical protein